MKCQGSSLAVIHFKNKNPVLHMDSPVDTLGDEWVCHIQKQNHEIRIGLDRKVFPVSGERKANRSEQRTPFQIAVCSTLCSVMREQVCCTTAEFI